MRAFRVLIHPAKNNLQPVSGRRLSCAICLGTVLALLLDSSAFFASLFAFLRSQPALILMQQKNRGYRGVVVGDELKRSASSMVLRCGPLRAVTVLPFATYDFTGRICMIIGERVKLLREQNHLSQGDIEKRAGLQRVYISRVENGHTVPSIETLEKFARALEVPMYQLFYDGENPPMPETAKTADDGWGSSGRDARTLDRFRRLFGRTNKADQKLLLFVALKMSQRKIRSDRKKSRGSG